MKVTVCIGSSCHVKGSKSVIDQLQNLITEKHVADKVELAGTFCTGNCEKGVCVTIDDQLFSVSPDTAKSFFETEILAKLYASRKHSAKNRGLSC